MVKHRVLTETEIEESIRFANGALAAAGHFVTSEEAQADLRAALEGKITFDEAVERAAARALRAEIPFDEAIQRGRTRSR
jgi:hypothetical protein